MRRMISKLGAAVLLALMFARPAAAQRLKLRDVLEAYQNGRLRVTTMHADPLLTYEGRSIALRDSSVLFMSEDRSTLASIPYLDISKVEAQRRENPLLRQEIFLVEGMTGTVATLQFTKHLGRKRDPLMSLVIFSTAVTAVRIPLMYFTGRSLDKRQWTTVFAR